MSIKDCPCGSNQPYPDCCGAIHAGLRNAETAEALMRSRYVAYALKLPDYIVATTDPALQSSDLLQQVEAWMQETDWQRLEIIKARQGGPADPTGEVEFRAEYQTKGSTAIHHEISQFKKIQDQWYYVDGVIQP